LRVSLIAAILALVLGGCADEGEPVSGAMLAYEPSLAVTPQATFAAWHGGTDTRSLIYGQRLDEQDRPAGELIAVSDGMRPAYEPDLVATANGLAVAWYEKDPATGALSAWLTGLTAQGPRAWLAPLAAGTGQARNPVVRQVGDHLEAAWIEQATADDGTNAAAIWHRRLSLAGKPLGPPRRIGRANRDTWNLNATVAGGSLVVTYDAALGTSAHELQMIAVRGDDTTLHRRLSEDDGHASVYPDLQIGPMGQAALTWFDERDGNNEVYLLAAPFDRLTGGAAPPPIRVSHSEADSIGAYVAWNGQRIGLAWSDEVSGQRDIFGRTFTADGAPLGPIRDLGASAEDAGVPAIRASGDGFVVIWNDYVAGAGSGPHMAMASSAIRLARLPIGD
jgi:hypothetical protein